MGKWKARRKFGARYNPAATGSDSHGATDHKNNGEIEPLQISSQQSVTGGLKSVEENMKSALVEERVFALNSLAAMSLEDSAPEIIAKSKILSSVVPMLNDNSIQVRLAAVGAFRNICAGGSDTVVEMVVGLDVLEPLANLLLECHKNCQSPITSTTTTSRVPNEDVLENPDICWSQILINTMSLMWNLCECCDLAVEIFNQKDLIQVIIGHIEPQWGQAMTLACADCLLCVSEDNEGLAPIKDKLVSFIKKLIVECDKLPEQYKYLITLAGVLVNLSQSFDQDLKGVLQIIAEVLDYNNYVNTTSNSDADLLKDILAAQQLALEILSNCCYIEDSDEDSNHSDSWENVAEGGEDAMDEDNEEIAMDVASEVAVSCKISVEVEECIKTYELVQKTLSKIGTLTQELEQCLLKQEHKELLIKFRTLRIRALVCLQNLIGCLDIETMGGEELLNNIWSILGQLLLSADKSDNQLLESSTGALRAVVEKLCNGQCVKQLSNITQSDLKVLFDLGLVCEVPNVRANLSRTVGSLACLMVKTNSVNDISNEDTSSGGLLLGISYYLLKIADKDDELWVSAEALDVLIDIFSEDKTDKLAHNIGLIERMKGIRAIFMNKCRQKNKNYGDHGALVLTVKDNLQAFIKYKNARIVKLSKKKSVKF